MQSRMIPTKLLLVSTFFGLATLAIRADDAALAALTAGGGTIEPGPLAPGLLEVPGENSFPVFSDASGSIVAAAGTIGESRIVAFAHDGFLKSTELLSQSAARDLVLNAIRWCSRSDQPEVALDPGLRELGTILEAADLRVEYVDPAEASRRNVRSVYVVVANRLDAAAVEAIAKCRDEGAGLVVAATPWAFADKFPNFADFPGNQLIASAGIRFRPQGTANASKPFEIRHIDSKGAIDALVAAVKEPLPTSQSERAALATSISTGANLRGASLDTFLRGLKMLNEKLGPIVPTAEKPLIPGTDPLVDVVVTLEDNFNRSLPAGKMYAIPAAANYPGAVPAEAPRVERTVNLDGTWRGWLSGRGAGGWAAKEMRPTGLHAAPGEVISVTAPQEIWGRGFEVVIGAYNGGLENRDKWERYPRLQHSVEINGATTTISNALGGLVTIRVPRDAKFSTLSFTITGAVEAPLFVEGETDLREWRDRIRKSPAPWAELAGKRIILALPSDYVRNLDDPDKVLSVWNRYLEKAAELCGGVDRNLYRAERIVFERQPAAGYMHSGYPVCAPQDKSVQQAVDAGSLAKDGNWGFFHEYGHNHQHDLWSLPGTTETTCNLWSVYLFEELIGKPRAEGHDAIRPLDRKQRMNAYLEGGRNFERDWSMWTALETYLQVQEAFGWEPFQKVFAEYNALPESDWPKTQQEKNDQWVIRLSKACGKNLAPFWRGWNVPLSGSINSELSALPVWEDHPVKSWE